MIFVITGTILYGGFNKLLDSFLLPGADFITIRPQLLIPVTVSLLVGPFAGGLIGLFGNFFGDMLSGYGIQFWHWSIANFFIGFLPGVVRWVGINHIKRVNEFAIVLLFIFLGNVVGLFEGYLFQVILYEKNSFQIILNSFYLPALISNTYLLLLIMPPLLVILKFLKLNIETRGMFFVLFFSLIIVTILSVVFIGIEFSTLSASLHGKLEAKKEFINAMISKDFRWIGIVLILIVVSGGAIGYHFSRKYMQPINRLAHASDQIKKGSWSENDRIDKKTASNDMVNLIDIFNNMASEIQLRETRMKNTIRELELKIDKEKEDKMVSEITETEFFKNLEKKSAEIKKLRK